MKKPALRLHKKFSFRIKEQWELDTFKKIKQHRHQELFVTVKVVEYAGETLVYVSANRFPI